MPATMKSLTGGVLALSCLCVLLSACNTTAGLGKDIENTGDAIKDSAEKNKPD